MSERVNGAVHAAVSASDKDLKIRMAQAEIAVILEKYGVKLAAVELFLNGQIVSAEVRVIPADGPLRMKVGIEPQ